MSITAPPTVPPSGPPPGPLWPLSVEQYHQMIDAGILTEDDPVELLDGVLVRKMPKYPLHAYVTEELREWFARALPAGYFASSQEPVTLPTSEPEPDGTVIRGQRRAFAKRHPHPADVALLSEVADSSLSRDRGSKKRIYARANIQQYWIINLIDHQIEVYRDPDAAAGDYRQHTIYAMQDEVPVIIDGQTIGTLRLADLLPAD
jgi:Uma2 family endonuclease